MLLISLSCSSFSSQKMHSWDVIPQTNYEHNWFGNNLQMKTEPQDMGYNTVAVSSQQPNSPQSMDGTRVDHQSPPAVGTPQSMMYCDSSSLVGQQQQQHHLQQRMLQQSHMGFNPLTPPGYPGAMILPPQTTTGNTTPFRNFNKDNNGYQINTNLTPSHTPPMDVTPPKSPKFNTNETPEKDTTVSLSKNEQTPNTSSTPTSNHQPIFDSGDESRSLADSAEMGEPGLSDEVEHFEENEIDDDDEDIRTPKVNSHGKMKTFKCKQCDFVAITKLSFWEHTRTHIKPEKMLKCPKCPFVTEYKHHLEYHMRNHSGTKPFQCNQCNYSCVNKSMLNSHMKSHSNIYQYRCQDCNYATKYCHSLKLHLRKYSHKPAMVLNADGTPNPLPIIDVYGTRRGPKSRPGNGEETAKSRDGSVKKKIKTDAAFPQPLFDLQQQQQMHMQLQQIQQQQQMMQQYPPHLSPPLPMPQQQQQQPMAHNNQQSALSMIPNLASIFQNNPNLPLFPYLNLHHMLAAQQKAVLSQFSPPMHHSASSEETSNEHDEEDNMRRHSALDLSQPNTPSSMISGVSAGNNKNKRKGRAVKLALMKGSSDDDEEHHRQAKDSTDSEPTSTRTINLSHIFPPQSPSSSTTPHKQQQQPQYIPEQQPAAATVISRRDTITPPTEKPAAAKVFECKFCDISFKHAVLYTIHMGYHGYNDVFQCNMCGEKCDDRVAFFLHIARDAHA